MISKICLIIYRSFEYFSFNNFAKNNVVIMFFHTLILV